MRQKSILWVISLLIAGLLGLLIGSSTQKMADQPVAATLLDENILKNQPDLLQRDNVNDTSVMTKGEKEVLPTKNLGLSEEIQKKTIRDLFEVMDVSAIGGELTTNTQYLNPHCDADSLLVGGGYYLHSKGINVVTNAPTVYSKINPSERTDNSWSLNFWLDSTYTYKYAPTVEAHALCLKLK